MSRKLKIYFTGPRQCRVVNYSLTFLDRNRKSYLLVNRGKSASHFLTLHDGEISLVKLGDHSRGELGLVPYCRCDLKHAAQVYLKSTLGKTPEIISVLEAIIKNQDFDCINFLSQVRKTNGGDNPSDKITRKEQKEIAINQVSLEEICQSLNQEPRLVRAALRRHNVAKPGSRWSWAKEEYSKIVAMIQKVLSS